MTIRVSKQHGVNPSLEQCFVCMQDVGVVLFGQLREDAKAPHRVCLNYEPCDACKKLMEQGCVLISIDLGKTDDDKNPYRSGGWVVVKDDFIRRAIGPQEVVDVIIKRRLVFVPDDAWDMLGLPRGEVDGVDAG